MLLSLFNRKHIARLSDLELIDLIQKKQSNAALGEIYTRYGLMMFGVNLKYLKNKMDAEDTLMRTFEKLFAKIEKSDIKNLKNWLYTVSKNDCLMKLRQRNTPKVDLDKALLTVSDTQEADISQSILKEKKLSAIELAIPLLKDEQKKCIELFYLKQYCYDKVSEVTGFELKKVKSYIQNGKRNLKLILEQGDAFK